MNMNRYVDFLLLRLCESILQVDTDFKSVLHLLPSDNKLANDIYDIIDTKSDVTTNYNSIELSDKNDEVKFLPDSQFQRFLAKGDDIKTKVKSTSKVGRMIRQLIDNNVNFFRKKYTDQELEEFVNLFKSAWDKKMGTNKKIRVVKGDDIIYWYDESNYESRSGTLGNSCMRQKSKSKYLEIYAKNPDKVSLVIITESDKLIARALLWKIDSPENYQWYLDRIYYVNDSDRNLLYDWVKNTYLKGEKLPSYENNLPENLSVNLSRVEFDSYPYADTFSVLYKKIGNDGKLISDGGILMENAKRGYAIRGDANGQFWMLFGMQNTSGELSSISHQYSEYFKKYIISDRAVFVDSIQSYADKDDVKYSNFLGQYYIEDEVVYSDAMKDFIPKSLAIDSPKYGIVADSYLKNVITEYIGHGKDPIDIYLDIQNRGDDVFKREIYLNQELNDIAFYYEYFPSNTTPWVVNNLAIDYSGYDNPIFLCYKMYLVKSVDKLGNNIIYHQLSSGRYISKEEADFYDIDIDLGTDIFMPLRIYTRLIFENFDFIKHNDIKISKKSQSEKDAYEKWCMKIYFFKVSRESSYARRQKAFEVVNQHNLSTFDFFAKIVVNSIQLAEKDESAPLKSNKGETRELSIANNFLRIYNSRYDTPLNIEVFSEKDKKQLVELYDLITYLWFYEQSRYDTREKFYEYFSILQELPKIEFSEKFTSVANAYQIKQSLWITFSEMISYYEQSYETTLSELSMPPDNFLSLIQNQFDSDKIFELFKKKLSE